MPREKDNFDVQSDNLELYFDAQLTGISQAAKDQMPTYLAKRLYRSNGERRVNATMHMSFSEKLWIMWRFLRKRVWVVVEDRDNGIDVQKYLKLREAKKLMQADVIDDLEENATFITADKELSSAFHFLHSVTSSPLYNYVMKSKGTKFLTKSTRNEASRDRMAYIARFLCEYEANRKKISVRHNLNMPEWLVLLFLYYSGKVNGSVIYKEIYKDSYNSNAAKFRASFGVLQSRGLIHKEGATRNAIFEITPLGVAEVHKIMNRFVLK